VKDLNIPSWAKTVNPYIQTGFDSTNLTLVKHQNTCSYAVQNWDSLLTLFQQLCTGKRIFTSSQKITHENFTTIYRCKNYYPFSSRAGDLARICVVHPYPDSVVITCWCHHMRLCWVPTSTVNSHWMTWQKLVCAFHDAGAKCRPAKNRIDTRVDLRFQLLISTQSWVQQKYSSRSSPFWQSLLSFWEHIAQNFVIYCPRRFFTPSLRPASCIHRTTPSQESLTMTFIITSREPHDTRGKTKLKECNHANMF